MDDLVNPSMLGAVDDYWEPIGAEPIETSANLDELRPPHATRSLLRRAWTSTRQIGQNAARSLSEFVLPPVCLGCSTRMGDHGGLCVKCWQQIDWIERPYCAILGTPFSYDLGAGALSAKAITDPPPFARARAAARHTGLARTLIHRLKFGDRMELAAPLAGWMVRAGEELLDAADLLVPVPLHPSRLFQRRFNQAALLAKSIGELSGHSVSLNVLQRVKATRHQVGLKALERNANVRGAFRVPQAQKPHIFGRHVLLIDDVLTTGATLSSAARALLRGGAKSVDVLTFSMVIGGEDQATYID